jgi:hypothetical protein
MYNYLTLVHKLQQLYCLKLLKVPCKNCGHGRRTVSVKLLIQFLIIMNFTIGLEQLEKRGLFLYCNDQENEQFKISL